MKPESEQDSLKLFGINIKNFKNLDEKIIDIGGKSFGVIGKNGAGKSSFIQALVSPLDAKVRPMEPIKVGEERSQIEIDIRGTVNGNPVKYVLELYFSPGNKSGRLVVLNEEGAGVKAGATFIKGLIGQISFDISKWLNESNEKKLKMLKQLTGCEVDIDKINKVISEHKADKKHKKECAEELEAVLKNHGYSQEDIQKYSTPIPLEPIQAELATLSASIEKYQGIESQVTKFREGLVQCDVNIASIRQDVELAKEQTETEIKRLEALIQKEKDDLTSYINSSSVKITSEFEEIKRLKENVRKGDEWLASKTKPNAKEINDRINDAIKHNEHHTIVSKHAEQQREMLRAKKEIDKIDSDVKKLEKDRMDLISKSQLPITGLSFTDSEILINGLPLDESQQNTQHLFDISVEVAMALNPTLKVIFLHDASLFDSDNLKKIIKKVEAKGYQLIYERVSDDVGLEIKFVETDI